MSNPAERAEAMQELIQFLAVRVYERLQGQPEADPVAANDQSADNRPHPIRPDFDQGK